MWQVGAGASAATKQTTASQMDGPEGADAKDTEESDESDAKKATKDLDRLAKKDPSRFKKAVSHPQEVLLQSSCCCPMIELTLLLIPSGSSCLQSGTVCSVYIFSAVCFSACVF